MFRAGATFDRYVIEEMLGTGGMGSVYRARDPKLERQVALKLLHSGAGAEGAEARKERLLREARAAAALDHPNTVAIFDVGEVDGTAYIAMELVPGTILRCFVGDPNVPVEQRIDWLAQVAEALGAAHRAGLVHRDVKPENVIVRSDGVVKVLDFGIAARVDLDVGVIAADDTHDPPVQAGSTVAFGTPAYMAPEQILNAAIDARADQFAWGVLAHELLSGVHPFEDFLDDLMALARAIVTNHARALPSSLPAAVCSTIERAMATLPDERFATMEALIDALRPDRPKHWTSGARRTTPFARGALTRAALATTLMFAAKNARARWLSYAGAGAIAAALGATLYGRCSTASPGAPAPQAATIQAADPVEQAYRSAREGWRRGIRNLTPFERVLEQDPSHAPAHLMLAFHTMRHAPTDARKHLKLAQEHRARLSPQQLAMLDVIEPLFRSPPDPGEHRRRAESAVQAHPTDAELQYLLAHAYFHLRPPDFEHALVAIDRAVGLDPKSVPWWGRKAEIEAYLGKLTQARASLAKCHEQYGTNDSCLLLESLLDERDGRCEDLVARSRARQAVDPENAWAYHALAEGLVALDKLEAARQALAQKWAHLPAAERLRTEVADRAHLDVLTGDFVAAERRGRELVVLAADRSDEHDHAQPVMLLIDLYLETRRNSKAAEVAHAFAEKREALVPDPREEDFALAKDPTPQLVRARFRAGELTRAEAYHELATWRKRWTERGGDWLAGHAWLSGQASIAETRAEAELALSSFASLDALPSHAPLTLIDAPAGKVLYLAGRTGEALRRLESAARDCRAFPHPFAHTRALWFFGRALEANGDRKGACEAYARVLARWGGAQPPSVTAADAHKRAASLHCP